VDADDHEIMKIRDLATYLKASEATVRRLVKAGDVPHVRLSSRVVRFRKSDIDRWLDGHSGTRQ
jgi:excisionase family DNA binding protein